MYSGFPQLATWTRTRASFALLAALGLLAPVAAAATTVSAFPTTNAVVTTGWTSPTAVYADDTTYATAAPGKNLTVSSDFGGFGFDSSVPSNATINSVTVEVGWGASTTASILTLTAQSYVSGVAAGTQLSDATAPTPIAVKTQLSTGFTRSQLLNGTFVVRVQAVQGGSNVAVTASLDYVKVTVDYSLPVAPSAPGAPIPSAVTESGLTATWTASATGTPAPTYTLQQGASSTGPWTNVTGCAGIAGTTCGVTGLTPNTTTWFQVVATNSAGSATSGVSSALTLPGQPALGAYTNVLSTSLTANWTLSGTTTGLTYTLQRGASSTGPFADVTGCVGIAATSCTDGTVAASTTYWYQVRALNATGGGAWSLSTSVTTAPPSNLEGDTAAGSNRPAVAIINPTSGTVGSWFKVQARVASPAGNVTGVTLYYNTASVAMTPSANYGTTATAGVWEYVFPALATGSYTLQVQATNASGSVFSRQVPITVVASGTGDGNLLVRDNASQLCADCHAVKSHSSETTSNTYGSWSLACRDCHTPHSTTNIFLVNQQITAPALTKAESPRSVTFYNRNGYVAGGMANPGNTGVCQVCHTRTQHYRQDGTLADHELTSNCSDCHTHVNGLKAKCTTCHGDASATPRATFAGGDAAQLAAPPAVATPAPTGAVTGGGAHVKHVSSATYRSLPLLCTDCHLTKNHQDGQADVAWGALATANATVPTPATGAVALAGWPTTPTCTNWCHGAQLTGGTTPTPNWTATFVVGCTQCHGAPPPVTTATNANHPQNPSCDACHGIFGNAGYDPVAKTLSAAAKATHINGTLNRPTKGCASCHGDITVADGTVVDRLDVRAAPAGDANAVDTRGNKVYTAVGVGAHGKHVLTGAVMSGKACTVCHVLPANGDETHADGLTAWAWSAPATSQGVTPTYTQPSCTNYCHSNAKPLGQASATTVSVSWTATGTVGTCTSCHATSAVSATDLSAKHAKHLTQYGYTCDECHAATMADNSSSVIATPARHVDGNKDVAFSTSALPALLNQSGGSYTSTTSAPNYTCASTYCHSGGVATAAPFSATASAALPWNTGASTCTSCHGWTAAAAPTIGVATGSLFQGSATHAAHVANAAVIGTNYVCGDCHAATVAAGTNSPITSVTNHVNGVKDVSIATRGSFVSTQVYAGSCTATYCHSSGQRSPAYRTIAWTGTLGCNGCHGQSTSTGAPDYANTGKNTAGANSHAKHVAASTDCATCHSTTANSTGTAILAGSALHTNGTINLALDTTKTGATSTSTSGSPTVSATCTNISCHGTNATAVSWGDTSVTCLACHGTTGAEVQDLGATFWANGVTATINTTEWAYSGHGKASGTYDVTGNPAAAFPTAPTAGTSECMYCHDSAVTHKVATNPYRLRGVTDANGVSAAYNTTTSDLANATCLNCHSATANGVDPDGTATAYSKKVATIKTPVSHEGAKHTLGTLGGKFCWDCHEPHGDRANSTTGNIAMIRASVIAVSDGTYGYVGASGQARAVNYTLQTASPPALGKSVETSTAANSQHVGLCQACHAATSDTLLAATAWTKYWNRLGYDDPDGVGGTAPVASAHNSGSTSTPYCISCHPHDKKFAGAGGDCLACHGAAGGAGTTGPNSRRPVSPDFSKTSHHVGSGGTYMGGALTNFDCVVCHAEGTVTAGATGTTTLHQDGKIDLRDADSSTGAYYQYDTNAVRALGTAGANGGNATWISETSGRTDDLVGAATVACNPTGTGCSKGLDRFCLSCHDKNGASQSYLLGDAGATALNPFNDAKITNEYDQQDRTRITDIASRVDVAAPDSASSTTPKDRDSGYAGVTYVRGADTRNDPPEGVFSRHAIRGKSTSVYGGTNAAWDGATQVKGTNGTYWNRANAAWSSKSVLGCADCHTSDGANATNGNAHGSSSEYLLKNGTGTATVGNSTTTVVCAQCHLSSYYVGGTHTGNGGDFQWYVSPTYTGAARIPSASTGGNVYGYACGTCHGGGAASKSGATFPSGSTGAGGYGTIHGTSQVIGTGSGGGVGSRAAYRFMNGNSMRFYDPGDWTTTAARSCYTLSAGDTWGGCIKHSGGTPDGKISGSGSVRPLNY